MRWMIPGKSIAGSWNHHPTQSGAQGRKPVSNSTDWGSTCPCDRVCSAADPASLVIRDSPRFPSQPAPRTCESVLSTSPPPSLDSSLLSTSVYNSDHPSVASSARSFIHPSSSCLRRSRTGFLGPRDKRKYLVLRGFIGSNAMILLYYAVQQMPLADATVIMFRWG